MVYDEEQPDKILDTVEYKGYTIKYKEYSQGHYNPGMRDNNEPYDYFTREKHCIVSGPDGMNKNYYAGKTIEFAKLFIDQHLTEEGKLEKQQHMHILESLDKELNILQNQKKNLECAIRTLEAER